MVCCFGNESSSEVENHTINNRVDFQEVEFSEKTFKIFMEIDIDLCTKSDFAHIDESPVDLREIFPLLIDEEIAAFPFDSLIEILPISWGSFLAIIERPEQINSKNKRPAQVILTSRKIDAKSTEEKLQKLGCLAQQPVLFLNLDQNNRPIEDKRLYVLDLKPKRIDFRSIYNLMTDFEKKELTIRFENPVENSRIIHTKDDFILGFLRSYTCAKWLHSVKDKLGFPECQLPPLEHTIEV